MNRLASSVVLAAALAAPMAAPIVAHAQQADAVANAVSVAERWLALTDAKDGAASWDQASASFRAAVPKAGWQDALAKARQPFGALQSRKLASAELKTSLPGAPDGEYVVIQYDTRFEHKAHAVETVVPMREKDGSWKVSGYYVK